MTSYHSVATLPGRTTSNHPLGSEKPDALLSTTDHDPFSQVLSRLGNGAYGPDHCVVLLDLRNAWPSPLSVWLRVSEHDHKRLAGGN